ncbi:MAG: lysozyme inhibitor LprI family protein [Rhodanobacter sp.]|jgi:uncharacterized protein YecT (DUF1311 family)
MTLRFRSRLASLSCLWLLAGCGAGNVQAARSPADLAGIWTVTRVAVDQEDQPHWLYFPDDPRLLGRQVSIGDAEVSIDNASRPCEQPSFTTLARTDLQAFIGQRFLRPSREGVPSHPTLADFGLAASKGAVVPLQLGCTNPASEWNGAWVVALAPNRLMTNYDNSGYVLVLERDAGHAATPSFACAKASGPAERAICHSATLAGYDRSVAAAWRRALSLAGGDSAELRQAQKDWLKTRNDCGSDVDCLGKSMRERVDALMQQQ